jgi:hypothetical protein
MPRVQVTSPPPVQKALLYHFARLQLPSVALPLATLDRHLQRTFDLYQARQAEDKQTATWDDYLRDLYPLDWYVAVACLEGHPRAWDHLFAARTSRTDCLLVDALRARAVRLYPRDEESQDSVVSEFWSVLLVPETPTGVPFLARYDGLRPLVPWLIKVFQNREISKLRKRGAWSPLPGEDAPARPATDADSRWHEAFCLAAREYLEEVTDEELLILGLRLRYRLSQRDVAGLLDKHEGTVSRQTTHLCERFQEYVRGRLLEQGWTGEDLTDYTRKEMFSLLLDEPRLSADRLAALLAARGKTPPPAP